MAKLISKKTPDCTIECYSERGIISYFFYRVISDKHRFINFLTKVFHGKNFEDVTKFSLFSELDFGSTGFGKPDGAFYFEVNDSKFFVFLDGKFNETYYKSCNCGKFNPKNFNSTICGQIELKLRLIDCISREPITEKGVDIFQENFKIKEFYLEIDRRYIEQPKSFRKIKMREGVKKVIKDYLLECPKENILILISTADEKNPLSDLPEELRPCFPEIGWDELRKRIYWISSKEIEKMGE